MFDPIAVDRQRAMELCRNPLWRAEDLGKPIPDSPHPTSVVLPLWEHVVRYEEGDPEITSALWCGYPRFIFHRYVQDLFTLCERRFAAPGEFCMALPSLKVAQRCLAFIRHKSGHAGRIHDYGSHNLAVVTLPKEAFDVAKEFWQHFGEIISSRLAQAMIETREPASDGKRAKDILRSRLASESGEQPANVFLFPTGMAAHACAQRLLWACAPGRKTVQLGFPYVDLLKIQTEHGPGVHLLPCTRGDELASLAATLRRETVAGVICEFPGNPLLQSADIPRLSEMLRAHGVPLIGDDTLVSFRNVDLLPRSDVLVTSLTKYFSGVGNVMGGSLILNSQSPLYPQLAEALEQDYEDLLCADDAVVLEVNSRDFPERMKKINQTAEAVCDFLRGQPAIEHLYYPKFMTPENFGRLQKAGGGYGGVLSIVMKDAQAAPAVYDQLRVSKGPSLGTNFALACPFILLAHYKELDWVRGLGIAPHLIRLSVGLEEPDDLIDRLRGALAAGE
jgi:cystathionine gamma-synthase